MAHGYFRCTEEFAGLAVAGIRSDENFGGEIPVRKNRCGWKGDVKGEWSARTLQRFRHIGYVQHYSTPSERIHVSEKTPRSTTA
jgi:hypothetical protein